MILYLLLISSGLCRIADPPTLLPQILRLSAITPLGLRVGPRPHSGRILLGLNFQDRYSDIFLQYSRFNLTGFQTNSIPN
jgi:hypothetical protein